MKTLYISLVYLLTINFTIAQVSNFETVDSGTSEDLSSNQTACISEIEYKQVIKRCEVNRELFKSELNSQHKASVIGTMNWPVKATSNIHDCGYYHISAYVDHDVNTGSYKDFNCGTITYDGHRGTDISIWPYNFYKMDNNLVEIIAAAPGVILDKHDGEFDRNCVSTTVSANYVIIQHADGTTALYWHMKKGSVTTKAIGQQVVMGEYLGVVGSSGSSSGPHLHFEVWNGKTNTTRVDPFSGGCNNLNQTTWFAKQPTHKITSVVKASVNTTDISMPGCPTTEVSNESSIYQVPFQGANLAAGYAKFYIFLRDELAGKIAEMKIINEDGSIFNSWTYTSSADSKTRYVGFSKKLPTNSGKFKFEVTYNTTVCTFPFEIISKTADISNLEESLGNLIVFPNPSTGEFQISNSFSNSVSVIICNLIGEQIKEEINIESNSSFNINLPKGYYLIKVIHNSSIVGVRKISIE